MKDQETYSAARIMLNRKSSSNPGSSGPSFFFLSFAFDILNYVQGKGKDFRMYINSKFTNMIMH